MRKRTRETKNSLPWTTCNELNLKSRLVEQIKHCYYLLIYECYKIIIFPKADNYLYIITLPICLFMSFYFKGPRHDYKWTSTTDIIKLALWNHIKKIFQICSPRYSNVYHRIPFVKWVFYSHITCWAFMYLFGKT